MFSACRRHGWPAVLMCSQCPAITGMSNGAVDAVVGLPSWYARDCVCIVFWGMSMRSLLSCACLTVRCALLATHICPLTLIWVGADSLRRL